MRYQADYRRAVVVAKETLELYGDTLIPLRLELLVDRLSNEIRVISYSRFVELHKLSLAEVITMLDSDLGACVYKPDSCQFLILYNDNMPTDVCRFTIGHELGHIFLSHHEIAGTNILSRTFVPKQQYEEFEKEANAFSRNLLSPASLANLANKRSRGTAIQYMKKIFFISSKAAKVRIDFIKRDLAYLDTYMISFFSRFHAVRQTRICPACQVALEPGMIFCPVCGSSAGSIGYAYNQLPPDHEKILDSCPRCGNTGLLYGALYCHVCGLPLQNLCDCGHANPSYADFCVLCGQPTRNHRLKTDRYGGSSQMEYGPSIPYDEKTLRVNTCPKCLYKKHLPDAAFCIMCGTDLYNRCDGSNEQHEAHTNPPHARFCRCCGRPTSYSVFLPAFTEMIAEKRDQFNKELAEADISPALYDRIIGKDEDETAQESSPSFAAETDELPF